jgi:uncharacterized protein with HEPN domain
LKRPSRCEGRQRLPATRTSLHRPHRGVCSRRTGELLLVVSIQDGVIRNLQTLAESGQRLSEAIKDTYPEVDWKGLAGFRNVLVHDYLGVDLELVYRAVEQDVPRLKRACTDALAGRGSSTHHDEAV